MDELMRTTRRRIALWLFLSAIVVFAFLRMAWAPSMPPLSTDQRIDSILILKRDHVLKLLKDGKVIRSYRVALGRGGLAPKEREGDERTPEGNYVIDARNSASHFYKALH